MKKTITGIDVPMGKEGDMQKSAKRIFEGEKSPKKNKKKCMGYDPKNIM